MRFRVFDLRQSSARIWRIVREKTRVRFGVVLVGLIICLDGTAVLYRLQRRARWAQNYQIAQRKCRLLHSFSNQGAYLVSIFFHTKHWFWHILITVMALCVALTASGRSGQRWG